MRGASGLGIACGGALSLDGVARISDLQSNATLGGSRKMSTMKKLVTFGAVALCATVGFAEIPSANVVGYLNRDGRASRNFYTPCFDKVDGGDITIQDVQLTEDVEDMGADLQLLDASRKCIGEAYQWLTPAMAGKDGFDLGLPIGMGAWVNEEYALPKIDPLQPGEGSQVTLPANGEIRIISPIEL